MTPPEPAVEGTCGNIRHVLSAPPPTLAVPPNCEEGRTPAAGQRSATSRWTTAPRDVGEAVKGHLLFLSAVGSTLLTFALDFLPSSVTFVRKQIRTEDLHLNVAFQSGAGPAAVLAFTEGTLLSIL